MKTKTAKYCIFTFSILVTIFIFYNVYENNNNGKKLEARFDKFAEYFYPHLKEISQASNTYKRMQISLLYDYMQHKKGRFAYETVNYYDGGQFLMKDEINIMIFLKNTTNSMFFLKAMSPINNAPESRNMEKDAVWNILNSAKALAETDVYIEDYDIYSAASRTKETIDSLVLDIQGNLHCLSKYNNSKIKLDLSQISDSDYDLSNY